MYMKKRILSCFLLLFLGFAGIQVAQAQCQLCYLLKEQAETAVNYLRLKGEMVVYAGCSNRDIARKVRIQKIALRPSADKEGYFEVHVTGLTVATFYIEDQKIANYTDTEMDFEGLIDIAYVHVRTGGYVEASTGKSVWDATCLGIYLGYDCDPCIDPFDYPHAVSH